MDLLATIASATIDQQLGLLSPMLLLIATMLAIVSAPLVANRSTPLISLISIIGVVVTLFFSFRVMGQIADGGVSIISGPGSAGILIVDPLSVAFQILLLFFMLAVMGLWTIGSAAKEIDAPEFFILLLGSALGMMLMVSTTNVMMMVLAIEMASLPSYAIVGFNKRSKLAAEASVKYVIFGAISSATMLYGASLMYGLCGSLHIANIAEVVFDTFTATDTPNRLMMGVALLCMLAGLAFKISAVPFHFWCPDAFEGAQIEVTTWLSVASKAAGLILLVRLTMALANVVHSPGLMYGLEPVAWGIGIMAAITCTVGNFAAYRQQSVKRLLAYSSISHAGYMMMAAALFLHPQHDQAYLGASVLLTYIFIYMFMNLTAFGVTAMVIWQTGSDHISSFRGLIRRSPWLTLPMILALVSLVGLPPLAGFWAKYRLLYALGTSGSTIAWILVVVVVLNTLVSLWYYMRVIKTMTLEDDDRLAPFHASPVGTAMVNVTGVLLILFFLFASPLRTLSDRYTANLYRPVVESTAVAQLAEDGSTTQTAMVQDHK